jgi:hypothetical protein
MVLQEWRDINGCRNMWLEKNIGTDIGEMEDEIEHKWSYGIEDEKEDRCTESQGLGESK